MAAAVGMLFVAARAGLCRVDSILLIPPGLRRSNASMLDGSRFHGRRTGSLETELLGVLGGQSLPAGKFPGVGSYDAADRVTREMPPEHVEADVPARGAPRDEAAIDVVPEREPRAAALRLQFPAQIASSPAVLEQRRRLGTLHGALGNHRGRRSHRRELHRSHGGEAPI